MSLSIIYVGTLIIILFNFKFSLYFILYLYFIFYIYYIYVLCDS